MVAKLGRVVVVVTFMVAKLGRVVVVVTFMVAKLLRERERERSWEWWGLFCNSSVVPDPKQGRKLLAQKVAHPISIFASIIITKQNQTKSCCKISSKRRTRRRSRTTSSSVLVKCMVSKQQTNFALCVELLQYVFTGVLVRHAAVSEDRETERYLRERERERFEREFS
jgi:hypothetical protein